MSKALILIDIQNDYFEGGKMELKDPVPASENALKVLEKFRKDDLPLVHIQHISKGPDAGFFIPDTEGVKIHENIKPKEGEKLIQKHFPNAFRDTELLEYLKSKNVEELVFCGMMTHMCIDASVRAAKDLGFECTVIGDACATRDLELDGKSVKAEDVQNAYLAGLTFFYAEVMNTSEYLSA